MRDKKYIFDGKATLEADNINAYLIDGPNVFVERRSAPLCDVPPMIKGSQPTDGGHLIIEAADYEEFIRCEPRAEKFIRRFIGAEELINGKDRWCLWLIDATEADRRLPLIAERIEGCRQARLSSASAVTRKAAATAHLFTGIRQPSTNYLAVPLVSSERRQYIPMGFLTPDVIVSNLISVIPNADLFHFAMLESRVHMIWTRVVCGRLRADYRYSGTIVYNNFPWLTPTFEQYHRLRRSAQNILDARALYPERSLASLYDPNLMPEELRAAHDANDRLAEELYGFDESWTELDIIRELLLMYEELSNER